jgi:hypothetical protein
VLGLLLTLAWRVEGAYSGKATFLTPGGIELGQTFITQITVSNSGSSAWVPGLNGTNLLPSYQIVFSSMTWTNGWGPDFSVTFNQTNIIAPGATDKHVYELPNVPPPPLSPTNPGTYRVYVDSWCHASESQDVYIKMSNSPALLTFTVTPVPTWGIIGLSGNLHFGAVVTGLTATATLTITNSGTAPLAVSGISYPAGFSGAWSGSVPAGSAQNVIVTFAPTAMQPYTGTVTVFSNAEEGSGSGACSGTGVGRVIGLSGNVAFGDVATGTLATATLVLTNSGNAALAVSNIACPAGFSAGWTGTVAAGKSTNVTVSFLPASAQDYGGTITVQSDKTSGANTIAASGRGIGSTRIIGLLGNLSIFGAVVQGQTKTATLTITNSGSSTLTVSGILYSNGFSGAWSGAIPSHGSHPVTVTFAPLQPDTYAGTATVLSDATSGSNTLACLGYGINRVLGLGGNLDFGHVLTGRTATAMMTVSNMGNSTLTISNIVYPAGFSGSTNGRIQGFWYTNVTVTFAPAAVQSYGGTITVLSDKTAGANTLLVSGSGQVASRSIGLTGNMAFGGVVTGLTASATLTVTNSGTADLAVTGIAYPPGFSGAWTGAVAAGASRGVTVTFSPVAAQGYGGAITVQSDAMSGVNTQLCSGTGISRVLSLSGSLAFGNVLTGLTATASLVISNAGNAALTVSSLSYPSGFSGAWSGSIGAGKSTNVTVIFTPVLAQWYGGIVRVNSDKTSGWNEISASGWGKPVERGIIDVSGHLSFGDVTTGLTATTTMTVSNRGSVSMIVTGYYCPPGFQASWTGTVAAGASQSVGVAFSPKEMMSYDGWVLYVYSDATSGSNKIHCAGTGVGRVLRLGGSLAFGPVSTGQTASAALVLTNEGNRALTVSGIGYPTGFSGHWSGAIGAGQAATVTVVFAPQALGAYTGTVTVASDQTSGGNTIGISGQGVAPFRYGTITFMAGTYAAQEGVTRKIYVKRLNGSDGAVSVSYLTKPQTALAGKDYIHKIGTLNWTNGDTASKVIKIPIRADGVREGAEIFQVVLKNPVRAALGAIIKTKVTIAANIKSELVDAPQLQRMDRLADALDKEDGVWVTSSRAPWRSQGFVTSDGVDAARSGNSDQAGVLSWLQTDLDGPGVLSFDWIVKGAGADSAVFLIDGQVIRVVGARYAWMTETMPLPEGAHTLRWIFLCGDSLQAGAAYLDGVTWTTVP